MNANINDLIKEISSSGLTEKLGFSLRDAVFLTASAVESDPTESYEPPGFQFSSSVQANISEVWPVWFKFGVWILTFFGCAVAPSLQQSQLHMTHLLGSQRISNQSQVVGVVSVAVVYCLFLIINIINMIIYDVNILIN